MRKHPKLPPNPPRQPQVPQSTSSSRSSGFEDAKPCSVSPLSPTVSAIDSHLTRTRQGFHTTSVACGSMFCLPWLASRAYGVRGPTFGAGMADAFTIRIFVPDGDPEGVRLIDRMNWTGLGLAFPRAKWPTVRLRAEVLRTAFTSWLAIRLTVVEVASEVRRPATKRFRDD